MSLKTNDKDKILVKELTTLEEAEACEDLQVSIWTPRKGSAGFCIPIHLLISQMELGGIVLGAYLEDKLIGFIFAVQVCEGNKERYHYSCVAGVHDNFRHKGVMEKLKWKHAEIANARGVKKIVWTYDPLQGPNANLNIRKLGGIVRRYKTNYYGVRAGGSPQNFGMPSDRFILEWYPAELRSKTLRSNSIKSLGDLSKLADCTLINTVKLNEYYLPEIQNYTLNATTGLLLVEIPANFETIRQHNQKQNLDINWRLKTREFFLTYFEKGYIVTDFISLEGNNITHSFYLLEKAVGSKKKN